MTKFRCLNIIALCLIIAANGLVGCNRTPPIPQVTPTTPSTPTAETIATHPELEAITPYNIDRLEQIDQWGKGKVRGIALSPDGSLIAVATTTGIYLYERSSVEQVGYIDIQIGSEIEPLACAPTGVLAFSPDGSVLAIANIDITLWDLKTGTIRTVIKNKIEDNASVITGIQFSSGGSRIFGVQMSSSGYPCYLGWGSLVFYTVETGELIFRRDYDRIGEGPDTIFHEKDGIVFVSYHDRSKEGYSFLEVDLQTGDVVGERQSPALHSMNDAAAVTSQWISTGDNGKGYSQAQIVDLISFKEIEIVSGLVEMIPHSDRMIIREQQELTVRILGGAVICSNSIKTEAANAFSPKLFSLDGSIAVSWNSYGDRAGDIRIWDLEQCTISEPVLIFPEIYRQLSISSDGRSVLTGSGSGYTFHIFDAQSGQMRFSLSGFSAQFSADGQQVFVVEAESVNAYDVETGEYLYPVLEIDSDYMTDIAVSPNGKFLVISNKSGKGYQIIRIGTNSSEDDFPESNLPALIDDHPYFSRDGKYMAVFSDRPGISGLRFWELGAGNELTQWQGLVPRDSYTDGSFNSDFTRLATLGTDGYYKYVYVWDIPKFTLVNALAQSSPNGHLLIINLEFIADDRLLFARRINPDGFLFWDVQTGDLLYEIPAEIHDSELGNPIAFSSDGRLLLALDNDGTILVWGVRKVEKD